MKNEAVYEVEKILDKRGRGRMAEYLIKWRNYGEQENTWEPASNLKEAREAIKKFNKVGQDSVVLITQSIQNDILLSIVRFITWGNSIFQDFIPITLSNKRRPPVNKKGNQKKSVNDSEGVYVYTLYPSV